MHLCSLQNLVIWLYISALNLTGKFHNLAAFRAQFLLSDIPEKPQSS